MIFLFVEAYMAKLTPKQLQFCREYLIDLNATQSAIRAGYSEKTAYSIGVENLKKPEIQQEIERLQNERNERTKINADYVLNRLVEIDQLDVLDILDENGNIKPIDEWSKEWRTNISSIEVVENSQGILRKIKFPDKVKNLELLGRHIQVGAWSDKKVVDNISSDGSMTPTNISLDDFEQIAKELLEKI